MSTFIRQRSTRLAFVAAALFGVIGAAGAATVEQKAALGAYGSYLVSQGLDRSAAEAPRVAAKAVVRSGEAPAGAYGSYLAERGLDRRDAATATGATDEARAMTAQRDTAVTTR